MLKVQKFIWDTGYLETESALLRRYLSWKIFTDKIALNNLKS